jgi:hypothetical protein
MARTSSEIRISIRSRKSGDLPGISKYGVNDEQKELNNL